MSGLLASQPHDLLSAFQVLVAFCIGHAVMDFPLQGEFIATGKNWRLLEKLKDPARPPQIWIWCMIAHCLMQGASVWVVTGSFLIGLIELTLHWFIDVAKCSGKTSFHQDQGMHYLCKLAYAAALYAGWQPWF